MEHDDKIAAILPGPIGSGGGVLAGGSISGGEAVAAEIDTGAGGGAVAMASQPGGNPPGSRPVEVRPADDTTPEQAPESTPVPVQPVSAQPAASFAADEEEKEPAAKPRAGKDASGGSAGPKGKRQPNNVRRLRIERMMSKAELARRANLSVLTIDRVEKGYGCRMDSKRKILEALGLSLADRVRVFGEEE